MRISRTRSWLAAFAVVPLFLLAPPPSSTTHDGTVSAEIHSHTVQITYREREGDLRAATIRVAALEGARPAWRGEIEEIAVYAGPSRGWTVTPYVSRRSDGVYETRVFIPAPDLIQVFAVRTATGESFAWGTPSNQTDSEEPEPKDPEPEDPPDDGDECSGGSCSDYDPWTCECLEIDPWADEEETVRGLSFSI